MLKPDLLSQGENWELRTPSVNGEEDDNFNEDDQDDNLEDEEDNLDDEEDEDFEEPVKKDNRDNRKNQNDPKVIKSNLHKTITGQNRKITELQRELDSIKNSKSISDEDLEKIKEKYDEEDLKIIEKIIERKSNELMDKRSEVSLEQREMNILLKKFPELEDAEIKHIKSLQKEYGYSLMKAHSMLFGRQVDTTRKNPSVSNSFWGGNGPRNSNSNKGNDDAKAYKDMDSFL